MASATKLRYNTSRYRLLDRLSLFTFVGWYRSWTGSSTQGAWIRNLDARISYSIVITPLSDEEGGGFIATVPDLPGCMSDGETPQEALANVEDAIQTWIACAQQMGRPVPAPAPALTH
jgi:antitoxin HicB